MQSGETKCDINTDEVNSNSIGGGSMSPLVEYNVAKDCYNRYTRGEYNIAIWTYETNNAVFQYNEAYLTRNTLDGQGFDCDYLCNGTIFQYNYSHDNEGGFMLVCSIPFAPDYESYNRNSIIRYNISQNDKSRIFQIHSRGTQGTQIYNNTIYIGKGINPYIYSFDLFRKPGTVYSYNNIFYNMGGGTFFYGAQNYNVFENNLFYGNHSPLDPVHGIMAVSIDDGEEIMIDAYAPKRKNNVLLYSSDLLDLAEHTIKVRVTGEKNQMSGGKYADFNKFEITPEYVKVKSYDAGEKIGRLYFL